MKITSSLLLALALGASASTLCAQKIVVGGAQPPQPGPGSEAGAPPPGAPPIIAVLDADGDRVLTEAEMANASAALLTLDKNGDGALTADELRGQRRGPGGPPRDGQDNPNRPGRRGGPPPCPIAAALDVNHDLTLSAEEIANAPAVLRALDANQDGQLDREELCPGRPGRGFGPEGGPGGGMGHGHRRGQGPGGPPAQDDPSQE